MNESKPVDLLGLLWSFRKFAAVGLVVAVLTGIAGLYLTRSTAPASVRAVALMVGEPPAASDIAQVQRMNYFYGWTMISYARLATTDQVLASVAKKHGTTVASLQPNVMGRLAGNSLLLEVRYTGVSEQDATSTLSDITDSLAQLSTNPLFAASQNTPVKLTIVQPATTNVEMALLADIDASAASSSSKSTLTRLVIVGGAALGLGLVVTLGLAFFARRRKLPGGGDTA